MSCNGDCYKGMICMSRDDFYDIKDKVEGYDDLKKKLDELEEDNEFLIRQKIKLKEVIKKLEQNIEHKRDCHNEDVHTITLMSNEIKSLENKCYTLRNRIKTLTENNGDLVDEIDYLNDCLKDGQINVNITIKRDDDDE